VELWQTACRQPLKIPWNSPFKRWTAYSVLWFNYICISKTAAPWFLHTKWLNVSTAVLTTSTPQWGIDQPLCGWTVSKGLKVIFFQFKKNGQVPNFRPVSYFLRSIIIISPWNEKNILSIFYIFFKNIFRQLENTSELAPWKFPAGLAIHAQVMCLWMFWGVALLDQLIHFIRLLVLCRPAQRSFN
jgi:hypothetical protein